MLFLSLSLILFLTFAGEPSCASYGCGVYNPDHDCQCNSACTYHDDCCDDYQSVCGGSGNEIGCPKVPENAGDRRKDPNKFRLVAWNVDWLFTNASRSKHIKCPGSCDWKNITIARKHLSYVVKEIQSLDADIIALEEVEDCDTLREIISQLPSSFGYAPYMHLGDDTYTGQNPGLLTRVDPIEEVSHSEAKVKYPVPGSTCNSDSSGTHGCSKHFQARFKIFDMTVSLFGLHLLAIPESTSRCPEREAQATVVANLVKAAVANGDSIMVVGDFNDYDNEVLDVNDNKPISAALDILKQAGDLVNVAKDFPKEERYTDWWDKKKDCIDHGGDEHSMIDHVLVSKNLYNMIDTAGIAHDFTNGCHCLFSDHWPIFVDFKK